ncbi:MAG: putative global regulator [Rickettsiales bacterium]|jgi:folate-binding protein YgfZ|nr:putative global regulator [Rickettsiales bacterium]
MTKKSNAPEVKNETSEGEESIPQFFAVLDDRAVIRISGQDARPFLQNLLTANMDSVSPTRTVYAALLTPQGKFLYDFFICQADDSFLLDCQGSKLRDIIAKLEEYKLRSQITIEDVSSQFRVIVFMGEQVIEDISPEMEAGVAQTFDFGYVFIDPRTVDMQGRGICKADAVDALLAYGFKPMERDQYEFLRLWIGLPDTSRDMESGASYPVDYGFVEMGAIDFTKGCFVGQEVTARVQHKGARRYQLYPVAVEGNIPSDGTEVLVGQKKIGTFCSGIDGVGLALLRIEDIERIAQSPSDILLYAGESLLRIDEGTELSLDDALEDEEV